MLRFQADIPLILQGQCPMKKPLLVIATLFITTSAFAQSVFEGFYGQIATGYESNQFGSTSLNGSQPGDTWNAGSQNANGVPLVIGLGYNYSVAPKWLVGLGVDYSALSQETSTYNSTRTPEILSGSKLQTSNRFNIFVTPGYEIAKDKLVYLKAGYSMVDVKQTNPNYYTSPGFAGNTVSYSSGSSQSKTVGGYVIGLGYKQMIASGFYGFAEANYMSYSKPSFSATTTAEYTLNSSPSLSTYQALVGIGYKF